MSDDQMSVVTELIKKGVLQPVQNLEEENRRLNLKVLDLQNRLVKMAGSLAKAHARASNMQSERDIARKLNNV